MIRIGIIDSGVDGPAREFVVARADFAPADSAPWPAEPRDRCGHGSAMAEIIVERKLGTGLAFPKENRGLSPLFASGGTVQLLDARVFFDSLQTGAQQVADALDWLVSQDVRLVNLSIGLRADREVLRAACRRAIERGVLLVGSSPARGAEVFPASYPGVVRATGDARCAPGEISHLATGQADFGGHASTPTGSVNGASAGCAHVSAALARWLCEHADAGNDEALAALSAAARYRGPERRGSQLPKSGEERSEGQQTK